VVIKAGIARWACSREPDADVRPVEFAVKGGGLVVHQSPTSPYAPSVTGKPKLLDQVRAKRRLQHLAKRTEEAYVGWIRKFILFHHKRHPLEMRVSQVETYLTHLAVEQYVATSTQNQTLCALLFLYRHVLGKPLPPVDALRAKRSAHWGSFVISVNSSLRNSTSEPAACSAICGRAARPRTFRIRHSKTKENVGERINLTFRQIIEV